MSIVNTDTSTGISYGVVSAHELVQWISDEVMQGRNLSYEAFVEELKAQHPDMDPNSFEFEQLCEDYQEDDDIYYYDDGNGLVVQTCGDGINLWVFKSPWVQVVRKCSPCFPNAGNLDQTAYEEDPQLMYRKFKLSGAIDVTDIPHPYVLAYALPASCYY